MLSAFRRWFCIKHKTECVENGIFVRHYYQYSILFRVQWLSGWGFMFFSFGFYVHNNKIIELALRWVGIFVERVSWIDRTVDRPWCINKCLWFHAFDNLRNKGKNITAFNIFFCQLFSLLQSWWAFFSNIEHWNFHRHNFSSPNTKDTTAQTVMQLR